MNDCIFCKIISGELPSQKVFEDDKILAFHDISPMAPVHIIIIPKVFGTNHINSLDDIHEDNPQHISHIFEKIPQIAKEQNLNNGYRVITNVGKDGGQTVNHLHFHLLGGAILSAKLS